MGTGARDLQQCLDTLQRSAIDRTIATTDWLPGAEA
jgi:hypothetical protein